MKPRNWELLEDAAAELNQIGGAIDFPNVEGLAPEDQPAAFLEKMISKLHDITLFLKVTIEEQRQLNGKPD